MQKISVIIPTYKAESYLPKLLERLKDQTIKDFQLLIIDSSSNDKTVEIAKQYTDDIIIIPQSEFDHGGTRAKAAKMSTGDILVFLTQDALPYDENTIENIVKEFDNEEVGAVCGRQLAYEETNIFGKHLRLFNYPDKYSIKGSEDIPKYGIKTTFLSDSFAAYRKTTLESIGWFKENLIFGEDAYAAAKMILSGKKVVYANEAKVYHSHSYTIIEDFKRYFDMGVFHSCESWLLEKFGKPEGEGSRYVKSELEFILENDKYFLIPEFFIRNAMKLLGYKLGLKHRKLPKSFLTKFSMLKSWFNKPEQKKEYNLN